MTTSRRSFLHHSAGLAAAASLAPAAYAAPAPAPGSGKPKTILLRCAWDTVNIGDIGHTPGTLRAFETYLPEANLILWASSLNEKVIALLKGRFPKLRIIRGIYGKSAELDKALAQADIMVHGPSMGEGTQFMELAIKLHKPFGMFGQSYFPRFAENPRNIELLNPAAFVYGRETLTVELLKKHGLKSPHQGFNPDGCFGIDVRDEPAALAFMAERKLEPRKFITIQLRTNTQKKPNTDSPLNPANPTPQQQADDERRAEVFRQLVTAWVKNTGLKVLIAPEVEKEIKHNKRLILDRLPPEVASHVVLRDVFWNADEAASVFARAHTVVCHEPHSPIIALANGTPILHTYSAFHSPKWHMFADIGLPEWLPAIDEVPVDDITARLMAIHHDYDGALAKVKKAMAFVEDRFAASCKVIGETIA